MATSSVTREIRDSLNVCLASVAGAEYNILKYLEDLTKNSFTSGHDKRFGVRPGVTIENEVAEVNKSLTYTQTFQFVLTTGFCQDGVSDTDSYEAYLDLQEIALRFNNKVKSTKAGLPLVILNTGIFLLDGPEFLDDKVAVLTGNIDIIYRLTL